MQKGGGGVIAGFYGNSKSVAGGGSVAVDKDKAIETAIGESISDFNPSQFARMLEETISKMDNS